MTHPARIGCCIPEMTSHHLALDETPAEQSPDTELTKTKTPTTILKTKKRKKRKKNEKRPQNLP